MSSRNLALLFAFGLGVSAHAQTYTAKHIVFKNPGSFTQAQLEAVSGMHSGSPANAETLTAAAQKLSDTGYFDDIGATVEGSVNDISAIFTLKPTPMENFLPLGFENLVWLSPEEINTAIKRKVPLFPGKLPENPTMEDAIAASLTEALAAKGIAATVEHETMEATLAHPLRSIEFRVTRPRPVVENVKLGGVTPALVPLVQKSVNSTAKTGYNAGLAGTLTSERILAPLFDAGYIDATLSNISVEPSTPVGNTAPVVISASLNAGESYKVANVHFAGAPLLSADAFAATTTLHAGDVASRTELVKTLTPLDAAYRKQGYMDVIVKADPREDTVNHQVSYTISVTPGEPYRLHEVTPQGLDPEAQAAFERGFSMKPGDLYNPFYVSDFLKNNTALRALSKYTGAFKAYASPSTHTVDLYITFFASPTVNVH